MIAAWLLVAHIAVLGYWLGSEFVINSTYRYVSYSGAMPFAERARLMDHVMEVDQHVRYALVLQASLGPAIAALYGYIPGGEAAAIGFGLFGALWFAFVELVHRLRHRPVGRTLGAIDRGSRYVLMAVLVAIAAGLVGELCLSTSPRLVGGGLPVLGGAPHPALGLELASLLVDDAGGLYARWLVPSAG